MILNWEKFLEKVKVKGIKKAIKKQKKFEIINFDLSKGDRSLKEVVKKVAKEIGLKGELKAYKSGAYGVTFLSKEKTLKITTSEEEAYMVSKIIEEQEQKGLTHIIHYDKVFDLKVKGLRKSDEAYFVILMERIIPLDSPDCPREILDFYENYLFGQFDYIKTEKGLMKSFNYVMKLVKKNNKEEFTNYVYDMAEVVRNYLKLGLQNNDFHSGNFGINSLGQLVSFDPMGHYSGSHKIKRMKV